MAWPTPSARSTCTCATARRATAVTRNLDPEEWGTESHTVQVQVNDVVARGDVLAFAGNTGPGGKRGVYASANTHLHIFYTRKDPTDGNWYFVDPYGIYGPGDGASACYPANLPDPITGPCARYPNLWKDGQPQLTPEPRSAAQLAAAGALMSWLAARRRRLRS